MGVHLNEIREMENESFKLVSIVVPTYKEAQNLRPLVKRITDAMLQLPAQYEIVVVDDDSRDGTDEIIAELATEGHPVRLITRIGKRGLSSAVIRGFKEAKGKILVCMDADISHPPESIPQLLEQLGDSEVDFVIGSRYVAGGMTEENWGLFRWLNSKVATLLARPFTRAKDPLSGFFAIRRNVFERGTSLSPIGYKIGLELIVKCGCTRIREVPIGFVDRKFGQSKLNLREQINYLRHVNRLLRYKYSGYWQLVQFCAVGATGVIVDLSSYGLLLRGGVPLVLARALAIWVAMTWNFFLNRRFTFSYARTGGILKQYPRFIASCGLGAVVSWSISVSLARWVLIFRRHLFTGAFIGIVGGTLLNFLLSRHWVFRCKIVHRPKEENSL